MFPKQPEIKLFVPLRSRKNYMQVSVDPKEARLEWARKHMKTDVK